jgi:hypothetical protein
VPEFDGVREHGVPSVSFEQVETLVVMECRSNLESVLAAEVPRLVCCWFGIKDCTTARRCKRHSREVKASVEVLPCGKSWCRHCFA